MSALGEFGGVSGLLAAACLPAYVSYCQRFSRSDVGHGRAQWQSRGSIIPPPRRYVLRWGTRNVAEEGLCAWVWVCAGFDWRRAD
jgi:hypothetical protein